MDFSILYAIQQLRNGFLDSLVLYVTNLAGSYGELWLLLGLALCFFKKTRRCGVTVLLSYGLVLLLGQAVLKDLIARPRPCQLDTTVELLVARPSSYSCPSTHSAWAFAAAGSVFAYFRRPGLAVGLLALLIAFGRLYLFVHFPTDVLLGIVLGLACAAASFFAVKGVSALAARGRQKGTNA